MFLLRRLTSRSSRSIAVMIAFAQSGGGGARGGRMGSPDDDRAARSSRPLRSFPHSTRITPKIPATASGRRPAVVERSLA